MTLGAVHRMLALFKYLKTFGDKRDVFVFAFLTYLENVAFTRLCIGRRNGLFSRV